MDHLVCIEKNMFLSKTMKVTFIKFIHISKNNGDNDVLTRTGPPCMYIIYNNLILESRTLPLTRVLREG